MTPTRIVRASGSEQLFKTVLTIPPDSRRMGKSWFPVSATLPKADHLEERLTMLVVSGIKQRYDDTLYVLATTDQGALVELPVPEYRRTYTKWTLAHTWHVQPDRTRIPQRCRFGCSVCRTSTIPFEE